MNILVTSVEKAFKNREVNQRVINAGFTPEYKNPEEFRKFMEAEAKVIQQVAKGAGLIEK